MPLFTTTSEAPASPHPLLAALARPVDASGEPPGRGDDRVDVESIFDATAALVFLVDADNRYVFVNRAWEQAFGLSRQQVVGRLIVDVFPGDAGRRMVEQNCRVLHSSDRLEEELSTAVAGVPRTYLVSKLAVTGGDHSPVAVCGLLTDITERKRGESRLRLLSDIASALVLRGDDAAGFMAEMCRKLVVELGGDMYFHYQPQDRRLHLASHGGVDAAVSARLEWLDYGEAVCGTVAGTRRPWVIPQVQSSDDPRVRLIRDMGVSEYACFPLLSDGTLYGTLSLGRRASGGFAEKDFALMQAVADLAAVALDRSSRARELVDVDRRRKEFLAMLAHELRGPLAPIGYATALLRTAPGNAQTVDTARGIIERQTANLSGLVEELLDGARVSQGKISLETQAVRFERVLHDAVEICRPLLEERGHLLTTSLPDDTILVKGDHRRLIQAVANLVANSAKYTPPGGRIEIEIQADPATMTMRVRDSGQGIDPAAVPRVFNLFEQLSATQKDTAGGLGIGLALVKALIELHGGTIAAHSDGVGKGSVFTVCLPRLPAGGPGAVGEELHPA